MNPPRNSAAVPGRDCWIGLADLLSGFDGRASREGLHAAAADLHLEFSDRRIFIPPALDADFARLAIWRTREIHAQKFRAGTL